MKIIDGLLWGEESDTWLKVYHDEERDCVKLEIMNGHHGILGSITLTSWRADRLVKEIAERKPKPEQPK